MKVCVGLYDSVGKKVVSFLSWYYEKMKTSISARKLFTLILVMVLLAVQYVDYETTLSAVRANHLIGEASSFLKMDKTGMGSCLWNAWEKNLLFSPIANSLQFDNGKSVMYLSAFQLSYS